MEIILALVFAALFALFTILTDNPIKRIIQRIKSRFEWWKITRQKGLKAIFPRTSEFSNERLRYLLSSANKLDTIYFAARTNIRVITEFRDEIITAVSNAVTIKFLLLDSRFLVNENSRLGINIASLGSSVRKSKIASELSTAKDKIADIVKECTESKLSGQILVYLTNNPIYNSAVIFEPINEHKKPIEVLYDISFGTDLSEKYMHYYRQRKSHKTDSFLLHLRQYYKRMFEPPFAVLNSHLSYTPTEKILIECFQKRIHSILNENSEFEEIRHNSTQRLITSPSQLLKSIKNNSTPVGPISVQIELTNKCTTRCEHCKRWNPRDDNFMPTEMAYELINQLREIGVQTLTFSGGEPTQHPDFIELLRYATNGSVLEDNKTKKQGKKQSMKVGILSNGIGLSEEVIEVILNYATWLRLSIDGPDPKTYGKIRKSEIKNEDEVFSEIEKLIGKFSGHQKPSCKLAICYTIQENNAEGVKGMIDLVNSLGLAGGDKQLVFKFAHGNRSIVCSKSTIDKLFLDNKGELQDDKYKRSANLPYLRKMLNNKFDPIDVSNGKPTLSLYSLSPTRCFTPYTFMLIDPYGIVYPCCFLYEDNGGYDDGISKKRINHQLGEFNPSDPNSLHKIWNNHKYKKIRSSLSTINPYDENFEACGKCTRHFIHNIALSQIYEEYSSLLDTINDYDLADLALTQYKFSDLSNIWL